MYIYICICICVYVYGYIYVYMYIWLLLIRCIINSFVRLYIQYQYQLIPRGYIGYIYMPHRLGPIYGHMCARFRPRS